ncbi:MAG: hypothetical protein IJF22_01570 [Clostridia bacterium]|nr:hypothetical protein [Clostridia bacterium]
MPGGSGGMKIGRLNFETNKIYLLGNGKIREGYSWWKDFKSMQKAEGVEKGARTYRRNWCCVFVPGIDLPKFSKLKQSVINIRNKNLAKHLKNLNSLEQEHEK